MRKKLSQMLKPSPRSWNWSSNFFLCFNYFLIAINKCVAKGSLGETGKIMFFFWLVIATPLSFFAYYFEGEVRDAESTRVTVSTICQSIDPQPAKWWSSKRILRCIAQHRSRVYSFKKKIYFFSFLFHLFFFQFEEFFYFFFLTERCSMRFVLWSRLILMKVFFRFSLNIVF